MITILQFYSKSHRTNIAFLTLLNLLLEQQVQASCGAIVNFIGDAVLAVFNTPAKLELPADAALECYKNCRYELARAARDRKKVARAMGYGAK